MKAAVVVLAILLLLSGVHVRLWLAGYLVAVPVPVLVLIAELATVVVLGWLIARAWHGFPFPLGRTA